jgi:hypothetical protein
MVGIYYKKSSFISYHNSTINCIYSYIKEKRNGRGDLDAKARGRR